MTVDPQMKRQRTTLIVFASFSIFVYAGAFYGWGPMQLLLEQNGNFATRCPEANKDEQVKENVVCSEQTAALLTCRFVGQLTVLTGPLWGYLSDRFGGHILTEIMGVTTVVGLVLLLCAVEFPGTRWDSVLYAAFILVGIGSTCGGLLTVETGLLFHDEVRSVEGGSATSSKAQSRVISLLNSLFDAGAMTYLSLWGLEKVSSSPSDNETSSVTAIVGGYLGFAVICLGGYVYVFRLVSKQEDAPLLAKPEDAPSLSAKDDVIVKPVEKKSTEALHTNVVLECSTPHDSVAPNTLTTTITMPTDDSISRSSEENTRRGNASLEDAVETADESIPNQAEYGYDPEAKQNSTESPPSTSPEVLYIPIAQRSVPDQLKSQAYIMLCIFFSFHMVSNVWTLTTARDFLKDLGDDDYGNRYLSIFTLMTPVSLMALPFVDVAIHKFGFGLALQGVNFLGIVHGIIKVSSTNLNVQIIGFLVFSFFRCFLFAVTFSCMPSFINGKAIGRGIGVFYVVSGVASFINIPLANMAVEKQDGDFFIPNLLFLLMSPPVIYVTYLIGKALVRDRESYGKKS
jgi:hypothetical protein